MRKIIAVVAAVACVIPALALAAADPEPSSQYAWCKDKQRTECPFRFNTNARGDPPRATKLKKVRLFTKCAPVPLDRPGGNWPSMRVENGKFSRKGTVEDVIGQKINYEIKGKFVKPRRAEGTIDVDRGNDCTDRDRNFVAKWVPPADRVG